MWNSKGCPRCGGNIFIDEDVGGRFEKCLQCGYGRELARMPSGNKKGPGIAGSGNVRVPDIRVSS